MSTIDPVVEGWKIVICVAIAGALMTRIFLRIVKSEWFSWYADRRWVKLKGTCPRCREKASIYSDHIHGDKFQVYFCVSCGFRAGPTVEGYIEGKEPARSHHWRSKT